MADNLRVAIFTNSQRDPEFLYTKKVARTLVACGADVCLDRRFKSTISEVDINYYTYTEDMLRNVDMIVVLGGDGTILDVCESAATHGLPILGINLGHLGFLTTLERDEIPKLATLADGNYHIDERMMARVRITDNALSHEFYALNDVIITSAARAKTADFRVSCDGKADIGFKSDGVIIATPTGSTAYSLSAGGPVIDTSTELFCVTPICPHSLTSRPIVFSADSVIRIGGRTSGLTSDIYVTSDGRGGVQVSENACVEIRKADFKAKLVRIGNESFFDILSRKMYAK